MDWLNNFGKTLGGIGHSIGHGVHDIGSAAKMTYDDFRRPKKPMDPLSNKKTFTQSSTPIESLRDTRAAQNPSGFMGAESRNARALQGDFPSFKKGGTVKKTGLYKLHKGEEVISKKKVEMARKMKY